MVAESQADESSILVTTVTIIITARTAHSGIFAHIQKHSAISSHAQAYSGTLRHAEAYSGITKARGSIFRHIPNPV